MEIRSRSPRKIPIRVGLLIFVIAVVLVRLKYIQFSLFLPAVFLLAHAGRRSAFLVAVDNIEIKILWERFSIERTVVRPIENIFLEIIYSGSTGKPQDAILNIFEGRKCIYQIHVNEGFTEDQFKELIAAFNDLKVSKQVI